MVVRDGRPRSIGWTPARLPRRPTGRPSLRSRSGQPGIERQRRKGLPTVRPIGIDLFAGVGGLSLGFEQAGFEVAAAIEVTRREPSLSLAFQRRHGQVLSA